MAEAPQRQHLRVDALEAGERIAQANWTIEHSACSDRELQVANAILEEDMLASAATQHERQVFKPLDVESVGVASSRRGRFDGQDERVAFVRPEDLRTGMVDEKVRPNARACYRQPCERDEKGGIRIGALRGVKLTLACSAAVD
jgi:hypothetical protein